MLPVSVPSMYLSKFAILTVMFLFSVALENAALARIGMVELPHGAFSLRAVVSFSLYSFITTMPTLSFMLLVASRFQNMWIPLGVGVAGFLSGMALAPSDAALLMVHPFVVMLKPAVAMSAQPDVSVAVVSVVETVLFLGAGLWMAKKLRYE